VLAVELLEPIAVEVLGTPVLGGLRDCAGAVTENGRIAAEANKRTRFNKDLKIAISTIADRSPCICVFARFQGLKACFALQGYVRE
jgi:hypothetical protein